ncbi:hypothetical protein AB0A98_22475 [Streptomyces chrestomyceticus]|uniref:hypothetical protein n=1 Tax=Streptomyces chrestomyceticus TaxID=68185 RepID=UPI0033E28E80
MEPEDRADDVAAALALLRVVRADLEGLEAGLLLAARSNGSRTSKPLLTFKDIAAALGAHSEQAVLDLGLNLRDELAGTALAGAGS